MRRKDEVGQDIHAKKRIAYTTIAESGLGALLPQLESKVESLQKRLAVSLSKKPTLEETFTEKQITAALKLIRLIRGILPNFDKGNLPNKIALAILNGISLWRDLKSVQASLSSTRYAIYSIIKGQLSEIISKSIEENGNVLPKNDSLEGFKNSLKKHIHSQLLDFPEHSPCAELPFLLNEIDDIIDHFDFGEYCGETFKEQEFYIALKKVLSKRFVDKYGQLDLKVVHPITYELTVFLLMMLPQMSPNLQAFISFLNPDAINIKVTRVKENVPNDYCYQKGKELIDGEELYLIMRGKAPSHLSANLRRYFTDYADTVHVKSERAKMDLLQKFIQSEKQSLDMDLALYKKLEREMKEKKTIDAFDVKPSIALLQQQEEQAKVLIKAIVEKLTSYKTRTFKQLLDASSDGLREQLAQNMTDKLDISYAEQILPSMCLIEETQGFTVISIQESLYQITETSLTYLEDSLKQIKKDKEQLIRDYHHQRNDQIARELDGVNSSLSHLIQQISQIQVTDNIDDLLLRLKELKERVDSFLELQTSLDHLDKELSPPFYCPESLDDSFRTSIGHIYETSRVVLQECQHVLHRTEKAIKAKERALTLCLEKERAAQAFAENMKLLNAQTLASLWQDKKILLESKKSQGKELLKEIEVKKENLIDIDRLYGKGDPLSCQPPKYITQRNSKLKEVLDTVEMIRDDLLTFIPEQSKFESLLKVTNLESTEGAFNAQLWVESLAANMEDSLQREQELEKDGNTKTQIRDALLSVSSILKQESIKNVSDELAKLKLLNQLKPVYGLGTNPKNEINELIAFITGKNKLGIEILAKILSLSTAEIYSYCANEERKKLFQQAVEKQTHLLKRQIESINLVKTHNAIYRKLKENIAQIRSDLSNLVAFNEIQHAMDQEYREKMEALSVQMAFLQESSGGVGKEIGSLELEVQILEKINQLLDGSQTLNKHLTADTQISEAHCVMAEKQLRDLLQEFIVLQQLVASWKEVLSYTTSTVGIGELLTTSGQRVSELRVAVCSSKFKEIEEAIDLVEQPSFAVLLNVLSQQLEKYNNYCSAIPLAFKDIDLLRKELEVARGTKTADENENTKPLESLRKQLQINFLQKIEHILISFAVEIQRQDQQLKIALSETRDNYQLHLSAVTTLGVYLETFPISDLGTLKAGLEKLQPDAKNTLQRLMTIETNINLLKKEHETHSIVLQNQKARQDMREQVQRQFCEQLSHYLDQRHKKYRFKDFFSSQDVIQRKQFIEGLLIKLEEYSQSGKSQDILDYIARSKFPGLGLQPILRRLIIAIKALDKQTPSEQTNYVTLKLPEIPHHQDAMEQLKTFESSHPKLCSALTVLVSEIDELEKHGNKIQGEDGKTAKGLAVSLRKQVDSYICAQAVNDRLSVSDFETFRADFMDLLHSQDDSMSKHRSFWKPFITNVAAAFFTLGIALGVKLIGSKLMTGHASFFGETIRFQYVQSIEEELANVAAAVSAVVSAV
ncbi:LepB protein [Legionella lansingensis]|uniref:Effector protein B, substrate of the Dot/Icm secretion system n=1 Tax=Legionella lansingensis TaxID=45067 RepID=A0A0W0VJL2_9GAMM|nr:hypothetical protein [Legionella lansingensis]KTD20293.1 effector protein B, substrate of the Dot/Icm secretion system [Legionella lansingensis]SNV50341.1 LepB protein [Legionella lansingensis]